MLFTGVWMLLIAALVYADWRFLVPAALLSVILYINMKVSNK